MQPNEETQSADAIVVLTGGALRLEHGFELLAEKKAEKLFISGVEDSVKRSELLHEYSKYTSHIHPTDVYLGYKARSTKENAEEIKEWVAKEHIHTILLVTGNYHIPRSILEIHHLIPDVSITAEPVFPHGFENHHWWGYQDGIRLMLSEYMKYLLVLFRFSLSA